MPPSCALLGGFAIGARDALLWQHYGNAWQSPAVIHQAQRTAQALRTHARTSDKIDAHTACAMLSASRPFHFVHTVWVLQREREMLASTCLYSSMPSLPLSSSFTVIYIVCCWESFRKQESISNASDIQTCQWLSKKTCYPLNICRNGP